MPRVTKVSVLEDFKLELTFDTREVGVVDLSDVAGQGIFELWNDRAAFESVEIGPAGELVWGERIGLCPDALYLEATGKKVEDLFPSLRGEQASA